MPVILVRRQRSEESMFKASPEQIVQETLSETKPITEKGLEKWLKLLRVPSEHEAEFKP
jgi:hypothetical protein